MELDSIRFIYVYDCVFLWNYNAFHCIDGMILFVSQAKCIAKQTTIFMCSKVMPEVNNSIKM